jgi:hypothetical protein
VRLSNDVLSRGLCYLNTSPNSPNKFGYATDTGAHPIRYGCVSDTMWRIRLFYSLWPVNSVFDMPQYVPIHLGYVSGTSLIHPDMSSIYPDTSWIQSNWFFFSLFYSLSKNIIADLFFYNHQQSYKFFNFFFIIIEQIIFYILYKNIFYYYI